MSRLRSELKQIFTREFLSHWFIAFATGVGALSGVAALLPKIELSFERSALILMGCTMFAMIYAAAKTKRIHLPEDALVPPTLASGPSMTLTVSCNRALLAQVNELASVIYGADVRPIPLERYEQWLMANCNILACLADQNQRAVGYFDILPLRNDFAEIFVNGDRTEHDIQGNDILSPEVAQNCKYLYLAGFAVREPGTPAGSRHASCLLWALRRYLEHFYQPLGAKQLLAEGATPEGERILQRYNFQLIQPGRLRRDRYPLYTATLSPRLLRAMSANPDWSGACRLSWENPAAIVRTVRRTTA